MKELNKSLTQKQRWWLETRGGRGLADVLISEGEFYVSMRSEWKDVLVKVPEDDFILVYRNKDGHLSCFPENFLIEGST